MGPECPIRKIRASAFTFPTEKPESDGTAEWSETTLVLAEVEAGSAIGIGYSYCDASAVQLIRGQLAQLLVGKDALDIPLAWRSMIAKVRNLGRPGLASCAISALDNALWDLK